MREDHLNKTPCLDLINSIPPFKTHAINNSNITNQKVEIMNFKFEVVSTGQRIGSLNADPELLVYPQNGRMRLTKKALALIGASTGSYISVLVDTDNGLIGVIADEEGKCKVGKNGDFTSAAAVQGLDLEANTSYKTHEVKTFEEVGLEGEGNFLMFSMDGAEIADNEEETPEEAEDESPTDENE
jgi:hypothetical protein